MRGSLFSVFDLAVLLGHAPTIDPHWMMVSATRRDVAFAFEELVELSRLVATDVIAVERGELVRVNDVQHTVVRLGRLVDSLSARMSSSSPMSGEAR
jgi:hypothetical protein